jgi:hypothetical protein
MARRRPASPAILAVERTHDVTRAVIRRIERDDPRAADAFAAQVDLAVRNAWDRTERPEVSDVLEGLTRRAYARRRTRAREAGQDAGVPSWTR